MSHKPKVFISHSSGNREQKAWVSRLIESLRNNDIDVFSEDNIVPGDSIIEVIEEAIHSSDYVVFITPQLFQESNREGSVGYEQFALNSKLLRNTASKTIPIYLDSSDDTKFNEVLSQLLSKLKSHPDKSSNEVLTIKSQDIQSVNFQLLPIQYQQLTADYLIEKVAPYLQAIESVQQVTDEIRKIKHSPIRITQITQNSPIGVSLEGVSDTVQLIVDYAVPWKRKHAEKMAEYARREKQYEIEKKRIEIQETNFQSAKNKQDLEKLSVEITKMRIEAEKLRIDNEKARLELASAKINLASDILNKVAPNTLRTPNSLVLCSAL